MLKTEASATNSQKHPALFSNKAGAKVETSKTKNKEINRNNLKKIKTIHKQLTMK